MFVPNTGKHCPPPKRRKTINAVNESTPDKGQSKTYTIDGIDDGEGMNLQNISPINQKVNPARLGADTHKSASFHVALFGQIQNIRKCYGCGSVFTAVHRKQPHDLILKSFGHRRYTNKDGVQMNSRIIQACYYHLNLNCTRRIEPRMELSDIIVHAEIRQFLTDVHKTYLLQFGIQC
jgi:hypothetical protein